MAGSMFEALKSAGLVAEDAVKVSDVLSRDTEIPLPFKQPWDYFKNYDSVSQEEYEDMNFIKRNWFLITEEEFDSYECEEGKNIRDLLKRNFAKIKVLEERPKNYGMSCLFTYFTYHPVIKAFTYSTDYGFEKICEANHIPVKDFGNLTGTQKREAETFYLAEHANDLLLYIEQNKSLVNYPNHAFTFERIQQDALAMSYLRDYLNSIEHKPNPKKKYYIVCKPSRDFFSRDTYYLKKAE